IRSSGYSSLSVSWSLLIGFPFMCSHGSRGDQPNSVITLSIGHHQKSASSRDAKNEVSAFVAGVIWIRYGGGMIVIEDLRGFDKRNTMLRLVRKRLLRVPFELHRTAPCGLTKSRHPIQPINVVAAAYHC